MADTWQELNWYPAYSGPDFFNFCSNVTNINAPESITEVDWYLANYTGGEPWTNLGNYANYFQQAFLPLCPNGDYDNTECFGTQNRMFDSQVCDTTDNNTESYWADVTNSETRSYLYSSRGLPVILFNTADKI